MAKKPKPAPNESLADYEARTANLDETQPDASASPAPEFSPDAAVHALAAQLSELTKRVNAMAAHHLQTYGKVI